MPNTSYERLFSFLFVLCSYSIISLFLPRVLFAGRKNRGTRARVIVGDEDEIRISLCVVRVRNEKDRVSLFIELRVKRVSE